MFFYIGNNCNLLEYVDHNLYLDKGWNKKDSVYYKGYSTECNISDNLHSILTGYKPNGIWAVIHQGKLYHPELRGFPLYTNGIDYTNISNIDGFSFINNNIKWDDDFSEWSLEDVVSKVTEIFLNNISNFIKYNPNIKLTVLGTGGLDSTLALAAIDSITDYSLVRTASKIREYTSPLITHLNKNHWAYNIINIQHGPIYNLVGFAAEVMTLRGYDMFNMICRSKNTTVYDTIDKTDYMYYFLQRPNIRERLEGSVNIFSNLKKNILSTIDHDYYIWHLDNNFHFNPFYDKRIPEICIRLSIENMIKNCKNGLIERLMIEKINSKFLSIVSDYKNHHPTLKNYDANINGVIDKIL